MNAFSFIAVLNNYVILISSFCRSDQIKGRAAYLFSMSDLQDTCHPLKKGVCGDKRHYCNVLCVQVKFQPLSSFILGNATSSQQQGYWVKQLSKFLSFWNNFVAKQRCYSFTVTIELSSLLSHLSLICNVPSKICNSLRICREATCYVAPIPSVYRMKCGSCEGTAWGRMDWTFPGDHHPWGFPSPGLSMSLCNCNNFLKCGRRERWGGTQVSLPLCRDWIRQDYGESVLIQAPNILATLGWMENKGLSFHSRNSHSIWVIEKFWFWSISWWGLGTKTRQMSDTWREGNFFAHSFLKSSWLVWRNVWRVHGWAHVLSPVLAFVGRRKHLLLSCLTESLHSGMGRWVEWCCFFFFFCAYKLSCAAIFWESIWLRAKKLGRVPINRTRSLMVLYSCIKKLMFLKFWCLVVFCLFFFFLSASPLWGDKLAEEIFWR